MASETDSSLSLSEEKRKLRKMQKKLKKKLEKKHKKLKKSKKKKKHSPFSRKKDDIPIQSDIDTFGPALPPHLLNNDKEVKNTRSSVVGPEVPKDFLGILEKFQSGSTTENIAYKRNEDDDLEGSYGPLPVTNELEMTRAQLELEERALELKMSTLDKINDLKCNQKLREKWMLELPDVGLKTGLAALNNLKRGFHQGKEKPDFSDRSSWTKTPNSCAERKSTCLSQEELVLKAQELYEGQRNAEQEDIAKKHKRVKSMVEIHQKKVRAEEKKKAKDLKILGGKQERRPFTRDVDLKLNKIDRNQTKEIVDKAKILHTKFSSGHSKYL